MAKKDSEEDKPLDFLSRVQTVERFLLCRDCKHQDVYILPITFKNFASLACTGCGIDGLLIGPSKNP